MTLNADRCEVAGAIKESFSADPYGTSEIKVLFEDWAKAVEEEILVYLKEKGSRSPAELAAQLKISKESVLVFIGRMVRSGKIKIADVKL